MRGKPSGQERGARLAIEMPAHEPPVRILNDPEAGALGIPRDEVRDLSPDLDDRAVFGLVRDRVFGRAHAFSARASRTAVRVAFCRAPGWLSELASTFAANALSFTAAPRSTS